MSSLKDIPALKSRLAALEAQMRRVLGGYALVRKVDGSPEGLLVGDVGDVAVDTATGTLYTKKSGADTATGWVAV